MVIRRYNGITHLQVFNGQAFCYRGHTFEYSFTFQIKKPSCNVKTNYISELKIKLHYLF